VEWVSLRDYILATFPPPIKTFFIYSNPAGEQKAQSPTHVLDHAQTTCAIRDLDPYKRYTVQLFWTFHDDAENMYYLEGAAAKSWGEICTGIGQKPQCRPGFKGAEMDQKCELHERVRNEIAELNEEIGPVNIATVGNMGAGKSSFLSTVATPFYYDRFNPLQPPITIAPSGGATDSHCTTSIAYRRLSEPHREGTETKKRVNNITLIDTIGWTTLGKAHSASAMEQLLQGSFRHGWHKDFDHKIPKHRMLEEYNPHPTLQDMPHALIMFCSATELIGSNNAQSPLRKRLSQFREIAQQNGIHPILVITKVDNVDVTLETNYSELQSSEIVCDLISNLSGTGFSAENTFAVQLYHGQSYRSASIEITAMTVLSAALRQAKIFLSDSKEMKSRSHRRSSLIPQPDQGTENQQEGSRTPPPVSEVKKWTKEEIINWVKECKNLEKDFQAIKDIIEQQDIDGAILFQLNHASLEDGGMKNGMLRSKFLAEIDKFPME